MIGARQLAQHERVEPVGLAARHPEASTGGRDLVGVQREHPQPRVQAAARLAARPGARSRPAPPPTAPAAGTTPAAPSHHARSWPPATHRPPHPARSRRAYPPPSQPRRNFSSVTPLSVKTSQRPDQEVPLRALMDKALNRGYVLLPLAAPHRPPGRAGLLQALHRASSDGPLPAAVEAPPRMTPEQPWAPRLRLIAAAAP